MMVDMLSQAGYEQYEISNFAKPGYEAVHNGNYWKGKPTWELDQLIPTMARNVIGM